MKRKQVKRTGQAPYTKYNKKPYQYQFKKCSHKESVAQSVSTPIGDWKGKACTVCHTITDGPFR